MVAQTQREIERVFKAHAMNGATMDASPASQSRIITNALSAKFNDLFARRAPEIAGQMVKGADKASTASLHASLAKATGGMSLKTSAMPKALLESYKASIAENVSLIKSISSEYHTKVQGAVMRSVTNGRGLEDLVPELEKIGGVSRRRAQLIAETETKKAYSFANRDRAKSLGVKKFEWIHSGGGKHPRPQHEEWDGKIFSYDDLPVDDQFGPILPGTIPNCRCVARPIIFAEGGEDAS
jgi:SPP1 gp7 family putative phage head morphogenesis protein